MIPHRPQHERREKRPQHKQHQAVARRVSEIHVAAEKRPFLAARSRRGKDDRRYRPNAVGKFSRGGGTANIKSACRLLRSTELKTASATSNVIYARGYHSADGRGVAIVAMLCAAPASGGNSELIDEAVAAAKSADVVIFVGGLNHNGGYDTEGPIGRI